ncbi:MAG: arylsulfatase [Proteobacteria bacterium]|nr:arylsulfatase [Pseudomonadota bacterium]
MSKNERFDGFVGRTYKDSIPWWPEPKRCDDGSPNVVVILFDDTGFSHFGCYGSNIETPNIDRLADGGLRYNNFHTTALCSPTRASLLTGRNHHSVGMRAVANFNTGFPHMRGCVTPHAATLAELLREDGYSTFAVGKWHLTPMEQASTAGPFDNWPLQRGFDRFYGFLQGETDQFYPELTYDNHHIDPPYGPEKGYHVTEDLIDHSISFIRDQKSIRPDKPFFLYLTFGATHSPHQAPKEFIDKYKGKFDAGWDVVRRQWYEKQLELGIIPPGTELAPHNPGVEPWDDLSENQQKFAARLQEAFAGFLDHTDHHIGRLMTFFEEIQQFDNTIVVLLSDNGASQEGGPTGVMDEFKYFNGLPEDVDAIQDRLDEIGGPHSHSNIPWGWAQVGNTPLKWYKQNTFGGGVRDPLIIHWPEKIKDKGGIRDQFHNVTDIVPTVLEVLDMEAPGTFNGLDQIPIAGTSMAYTFEKPDEPTQKKVQYFEMFGHRGIWADGWKAVTYHHKGTPYGDDEWELYHLDEDFSEIHNKAAENPEKLRELIDMWWIEAGKYGVLPLDDRNVELFRPIFKPGSPHAKRSYTYYPPISHLPAEASPPIGARSWVMKAAIERPSSADEGVLIAQGTQNVGYSWYVKDNRLIFDYNIFTDHHLVQSAVELPLGSCSLQAAFKRDGQTGTITLSIDDKPCGSITVPYVLRMISSTGMDIGRDGLSPVSSSYSSPFSFSGTIRQIDIELLKYTPPQEKEVAEAAFQSEMTQQ